MRALRYHTHGRPGETLALEEVPTPEPGPGQVRVRLTHRPIHPADLSMVRGTYGRSRPLPAVGGNEGVGVLEAVGDGVGLEVGQRVVKLGEAPTWQESVVLEAVDVWPVPDDLGDEDAGQLFVNPLTAWLLLRAAGLEAGDTVVLTAGASAVARIAAEVAHSRGAVPVAVVRSAEHRDRLEALGACVVVAEENTKPNRAALQEACGGGAAAVLDAVAGETGALARSALLDGGRHVVYGALSQQPLPVSPAALIYRDATVSGVWRTQWASRRPAAEVWSALDALARLRLEGVYSLPVAARFGLEDATGAVRAATARGRWGKVLFVG